MPRTLGRLTNIFFAGVLTIFLVVGCGGEQEKKKDNRVQHLSGKTVTETIDDNRQRLLAVPGVVKIEPADCGPDSCIRIYVDKKTDLLTMQLPTMLETWRVELIEAGR